MVGTGLLSTAMMRIRGAEMRDAEVITRFNLELATETEDLRLEPAVVARGVEALLREPAKGIYYLAEVEGAVVGQVMITYEWSDWRNANLWWLQSVYVHRDHRGKGVFAALFRHVETLARESTGVCGIRLYMHQDNRRARSAYEKLGMHQTKYQVFELDFRNSSP
jgi:GNAT superfamily N-acetyltransferase